MQALLLIYSDEVFRRLRGRIRGVVFLATPQRGDGQQRYPQILAQFGQYRSIGPASSETSDGLVVNSAYYKRLSQEWHLLPEIAVHSIFLATASERRITSRTSATLGVASEVHVPLSVASSELSWSLEDNIKAQQAVELCVRTLCQGHISSTDPALSITHSLPPAQCPVCSVVGPRNLVFGPSTSSTKYHVDLGQSAQDTLRVWGRSCVLANAVYRLSSIWLGQSQDDLTWMARLLYSYTCRTSGPRTMLSTEHGK